MPTSGFQAASATRLLLTSIRVQVGPARFIRSSSQWPFFPARMTSPPLGFSVLYALMDLTPIWRLTLSGTTPRLQRPMWRSTQSMHLLRLSCCLNARVCRQTSLTRRVSRIISMPRLFSLELMRHPCLQTMFTDQAHQHRIPAPTPLRTAIPAATRGRRPAPWETHLIPLRH